jgi:hypothetical protein
MATTIITIITIMIDRHRGHDQKSGARGEADR